MERDVNTNAARFDDSEEQGERPPITDVVGIHRVVAEVMAVMQTFLLRAGKARERVRGGWEQLRGIGL